MAKKPSLGRQKIKIAKIEIKNHLQVTFSKRRSGLFKKASELCTLCGVEIAIIVFSPAGKVFSFGHPNVEPIIDRFLTRNFPNSNALQIAHQGRNPSIPELNMQLTQFLNELEIEKKRGENLDLMRKASNQNHYWWEAPINTLGLHELEQLRDSMEILKKNVAEQASRVMMNDHVNNRSSILAAANNVVGNGGVGVFDHYEHKPNHIMMASSVAAASRAHNFGYAQGLF